MKIDGEATLCCWAIDVDVAQSTYTIPPRPASEWMLAVTIGSNLDVVPGLLEDPGVLDDELAVDDGAVADECQAAAREAITQAAGCPWWTATRLARGIIDTWIGGDLVREGVDPTRLPFATYLSAAYRVATRNMEDKDRMRLDMELDKPPTDVPVEQWWDGDAAAAGFMAAAAALDVHSDPDQLPASGLR